MNNMLEKAKKDLRTYAKHNKTVMFSVTAAIELLMTGNIVRADEIATTKQTIESTVNTINGNISEIRRSNEKLLRIEH